MATSSVNNDYNVASECFTFTAKMKMTEQIVPTKDGL